MQGDFSRDTFEVERRFGSVLMQQGRVVLDADWNEQSAILLHHIRSLTADLIGSHAGPGDGFRVDMDTSQRLIVQPGRYYVEGVLCENFSAISYAQQPFFKPLTPLPAPPYILYLDVWERFISAVQDENLRDPALGGVDTSARSQVVWQVKAASLESGDVDAVNAVLAGLRSGPRPVMRAAAGDVAEAENGTTAQSQTGPKYLAEENRLYRVEIHATGSTDGASGGQASFKWSRENGSVVFPIAEAVAGERVTLKHFQNAIGRPGGGDIRLGSLVEILDDDYILRGGLAPDGRPAPLYFVDSVDGTANAVVLRPAPPPQSNVTDFAAEFTVGRDAAGHPFLRRWEFSQSERGQPGSGAAGLLPVREREWIALEDGIHIFFEPTGIAGIPRRYRAGDYWQIPARTATANIEWPTDGEAPIGQPPRGTHHGYAPLAIIGAEGVIDCRRPMPSLW